MQPSSFPEGGSVDSNTSVTQQPGAQLPGTLPATQGGSPAPLYNLPTEPLGVPGVPGSVPAAQTTVSNAAPTTSAAPAAADDADLIEKEWVNKAKQIVASTQADPYQQSKEMTIFRADYMKKRYNKTIKLSE